MKTADQVQAKQYNLIVVTDANGLPLNRVVFTGDYYSCLGAFQKRCPFSFMSHKEYSYTTYDIIEAN